MTKYPLESLYQKLHVKHGFAFKGNYFSDIGKYVVLTPGNFLEKGGFFRDKSKDKFYMMSFPREYLLSKGDLIVAMTEQTDGLLGSCAFVPEDNLYLHNQRLGLIDIDTKFLDKSFLYYLFQTKNVRTQLRQSASGTKVKHTSPDRIYDLIVPTPPLYDQKKIAKILSLFDNKIELNNKINIMLEAVSKLIYDYWFVQFDYPDLNGNPYKSSGGEMVYDSELKKQIPKGWTVTKLSEVAECIMGQSPKGETYNKERKGLPLINGPADYKNGALYGETFTTSPTRVCYKNDLVLCIRATIGNLVYSESDFCLGRGVAAVRPKSNQYSESIYFHLLNEIKRFQILASGSIIKGISKEDLTDSHCLFPSEKILVRFHEITKPMFDMQRKNKEESKILENLRDWLLPMLINKQVTFNP